MKNTELSKYCIDSLKKAGADKSEFNLVQSKKYEINVEGDEVTLFRTIFNTELNLTAIKDNKDGSLTLNKTDEESLDRAVESVMDICSTSREDEANDIAPWQSSGEFSSGEVEPDLDKMYLRLKRFTEDVKRLYPDINLLTTVLDFTQYSRQYANSYGADFKTSKGVYNFSSMFAAKSGEKSSSFNASGFCAKDLDKEIMDCGAVNTLLKQSVEQLDTKTLEGKFVGDVIITPDCLNEVVSFYINTFLGEGALISETSILRDKLGELVASPKFTLHSKPLSEELADGYFVTLDGFEARDMTLIEKGVLRSFLLSLYGARKTGKERSLNSGGAYIIDAGDEVLDDMIRSTERGILLSRFSGGNPSSSGDFSGVAKNSYYIENGEIKYPVSETMVSGNLYEMFKNIKDISVERINFGSSIMPWIRVSGVTISGK